MLCKATEFMVMQLHGHRVTRLRGYIVSKALCPCNLITQSLYNAYTYKANFSCGSVTRKVRRW